MEEGRKRDDDLDVFRGSLQAAIASAVRAAKEGDVAVARANGASPGLVMRRDTPAQTAGVLTQGERHYAVAGLVAGLTVIALSFGLFYLGISGRVTWIAKAFGLSSELVGASPGVHSRHVNHLHHR
jgi:hypothetical protein